MANRWAFLVGVEKCLHPAAGDLPFADGDAQAIAVAFSVAGIPKSQQLASIGTMATKSQIESRLRSLNEQLKKGDEVIVFWAGRGHTTDGHGYFNCWDTLPEDRDDTAMSFADLFATITATKAAACTFLMSVDGLAADELRERFTSSAKAVGLFACEPEQKPLAAGKGGLWSQLLVDAFSGRARKAADAKEILTGLSLQRYIEEELPRLLRKHLEGGARQSPILLGEQNAATVLADFSKLWSGTADMPVLDAARLRRVLFRSESMMKVRELTNFRKSFQVPDNASPSSRKFITRIASDDIRAELDRVFDLSREQLGYKRKDLEISVETDGTGYLRTPDFEYSVFVDLDLEEPSRVIWRREAGHFTDAEFLRGPNFAAIFGTMFDKLVFELAKSIVVNDFIDRLEDEPPAGMKLTADSDGRSCHIALKGIAGVITVHSHSVTIGGRSSDASGLLDLFLQFIRNFGTLGEPMAIGPRPGD